MTRTPPCAGCAAGWPGELCPPPDTAASVDFAQFLAPLPRRLAVLGGGPYSYFRYEQHLAALSPQLAATMLDEVRRLENPPPATEEDRL